MKPEDLTEALIVEALCDKEPSHYQDYEDFAHDCHSVSLALVRSGLLGEGGPNLRVARGACMGVGGQHSWVVLGHPYDQTATIVDLTLWSYNGSQPRIWIGDMMSGFHHPKGMDWIFNCEKPHARGGKPIEVDTIGLSASAKEWIRMIGPMDAAGWGALWSRSGMLGWPAKEILEHFIDQHPTMVALVPIDIVGMVTDRNPQDLYW
jgi:hypothetical protein